MNASPTFIDEGVVFVPEFRGSLALYACTEQRQQQQLNGVRCGIGIRDQLYIYGLVRSCGAATWYELGRRLTGQIDQKTNSPSTHNFKVSVLFPFQLNTRY